MQTHFQIVEPGSWVLVSDAPLARLAERHLWFRGATMLAVGRATRQAHERNPAGYHHRHPAEKTCRFDDDCPFTRHG